MSEAIMPRSRRALLALAAAAALGATATSDAATEGSSSVARGLDLFLHAPDRGAPGATLPVQVVALGFPTAITLRPLEGAPIARTIRTFLTSEKGFALLIRPAS
jgi:hypothetical protein